MGVRSRMANIRIVNRGGSTTSSIVSTAIPLPLTSEMLLQRQLKELQKDPKFIQTLYPRTSGVWVAALRTVLDRNIFSPDVWNQDKFMLEFVAGEGPDFYTRSASFKFRCWEKNNRRNTLVQGNVDYQLGQWDDTAGFYPLTLNFEKLLAVPQTEQKKISESKKNKASDPTRLMTTVEMQNLHNLDAVAAGAPVEIDRSSNVNGGHYLGNSPYYMQGSLFQYLASNVFNDANTGSQISTNYLDLKSDGSRFECWRTHQKKNTYRVATVKIQKVAPGVNVFNLVKWEKP